MVFNGACRACGKEIPSQRILGNTVVCECGWAASNAMATNMQKISKQTVIAFVIASCLVFIGFVHSFNWGRHAYSIPFLKTAQILGMSSPAGLESIIEACRERGKWACVHDTSFELFEKTKNPQPLGRLAVFYSRLNQPQLAVSVFEAYVKAGGNESGIAFEYGQILEKTNQREQAISWYDKSMATSGDRLPVRAMTALVRILMQDRRYEEAYERIVAFHGSAGNATSYFTTELSELERLLPKAARAKKMAAR
jgi:tetratricopeptide (TPR) repeat protein